MQTASDIFLGFTEDQKTDRHFYVRQLKNRRLGSISGSSKVRHSMPMRAFAAGRLPGRMHAAATCPARRLYGKIGSARRACIICDSLCRANQSPCTTEGRERHEGGPCAQVISSRSAARYAARDLRRTSWPGWRFAAVALPSPMATAHLRISPRHRIDRFRGRIDRLRGHRSQSFSCGLRRFDDRPDFRRRPCHLGHLRKP